MVHYLAGQLSSALAISAQTVVKPAAGKLVSVIVGAGGTLKIDDAATVGAISAATTIATALAPGFYQFNFPFLNGLILTPTTSTCSVSFE